MDDDVQQFSLRWHNHQNSVIGALSRMLSTETLTDVTLSANGTSIKAHRLVLASCSQYFAQLFKEVEADSTLVVVLGCEAPELKLLLTFMYTGEVTTSKQILPSLLRLAQTLKVSGLTDADTNPSPTTTEQDQNGDVSNSPVNLEVNDDVQQLFSATGIPDSSKNSYEDSPTDDMKETVESSCDLTAASEKDRLSKLDQIVQNLYKIGNATNASSVANVESTEHYDRKWRMNSSICTICNKRLSNQYNLRVHMETHAGRRHACRACTHVSRSRDALRKHVAYRHAPQHRVREVGVVFESTSMDAPSEHATTSHHRFKALLSNKESTFDSGCKSQLYSVRVLNINKPFD